MNELSRVPLSLNEKVLWQRDVSYSYRHVILRLLFGVIAIGLLTLALVPARTAQIPLFVRFLSFAVAVPCIGLSWLWFVYRPASTFVVTNERVIPLDSSGEAQWDGGFYLDFGRDCRTTNNGNRSRLKLPTLQLDHGEPEWVSVGPIPRSDVALLKSEFERLSGERRREILEGVT